MFLYFIPQTGETGNSNNIFQMFNELTSDLIYLENIK